MSFKDHFSKQSSLYSRYRPHYPQAMFAELSALADQHRVLWDCACGSGQAAHGFAAHFDQIWATDASANQIANALPHPGVSYSVCPAEQTDFPDHSVDMVNVAQALHWFNQPAFYQEAQRVLAPGGLLTALAYSFPQLSAEIDPVFFQFHSGTLADYWPAERAMVDVFYQNIDFPFNELPSRSYQMICEWDFNHFLGYLNTWSATQAYKDQQGGDPVTEFAQILAPLWGEPSHKRSISWPVRLRISKKQ